MTTVILTIHFLISVALVATVLLQRSEGGALGIGGGPGSLMSGRGAANALTRATAVLGAMFFATSILLTVIPNMGKSNDSVVIGAPVTNQTPAPAIPAKSKPAKNEPAKSKLAPKPDQDAPEEE